MSLRSLNNPATGPAAPFYTPEDGWAADFIPFYWEGMYHLFYLKDYRDPAAYGEGTPWFHLATRDLVNFEERGEALARGTRDEQDLYVFTGSVVRGEGRFHIFYTGHNPHFRQGGKPEQAVMHAVSEDLDHWTKLPEHTFFAPQDHYEPHDWRDPYVFYHPPTGEYWMLLAARRKAGLSRRRGCTALCTSRDLAHWEVREPFYSPGLYFTHECPDLFRWGDWWYLLFSEFSDACVTRYRMARDLGGPWFTPTLDTFDGRALYAAKTAGDGNRRYLFGWNPTRVGEQDDGDWQWGGNLAVHELRQRQDGTLAVCLPEAVSAFYQREETVSFGVLWNAVDLGSRGVRIDASRGYGAALAGEMPARCRIEVEARWEPGARGVGILLRSDGDLERGYWVRLEPERRRLVFDRWPRPGDRPYYAEVERPLFNLQGNSCRLTVLVDGSVCEVYCNGDTAMSVRMYDHSSGAWGVFGQEAAVDFNDCGIFTPVKDDQA